LKQKVLISACLLGVECRYDGQHCKREFLIDKQNEFEFIPVCPEELGGLPTPRPPAEIQNNGKVETKAGVDVTSQYNDGAQKAFEAVKNDDVKLAYLKSRSPMCGCGEIYDGSFTGNKKGGDGIFARLLKSKGIKIIPVD